ncbi:NADH-quinone oxidoreductase subunit K, partial [Pseudokineococcus marinus]
MTTALLVALLAAAGTALVLQRGALRLVVGFVLLGHVGTVLVLSASGGDRRGVPLLGQGPEDVPLADPLPQAFVLTAVVIAFAVTVHLLGVLRAESSAADDDEEDAAVEERQQRRAEGAPSDADGRPASAADPAGSPAPG